LNIVACAVREYTADLVSVGRCWFNVQDGKCPRHGDVREVQRKFVETGRLTDEFELATWKGRQPTAKTEAPKARREPRR
jgi:hypothetical protein